MDKLPMYEYLKRPEVMSRWLNFDNGVKGFADSIIANTGISQDQLLFLFGVALTSFPSEEQDLFIQDEGLQDILDEVITTINDLDGFKRYDYEDYIESYLPEYRFEA